MHLMKGHQREVVLQLFNKNEKLNHMSKIGMLYAYTTEQHSFKCGLLGEESREGIRYWPRQSNTYDEDINIQE